MLVSVIMPVFNSIQFLQESIDSILCQSHTDLEFIILDDGSTQSVWELIQSYNDSRIVALRNFENIGLTKSLNICLDKVRGDFVVRHDSDDISLPTRIEKQLEFFEKNTGFVTCWYSNLTGKQQKWKIEILEGQVTTEGLLSRYTTFNNGNDAGTIYSIEAVHKIGYFDERLYLGQTYNYNRRIQRFFKGAVLPEVLYLVRRWHGQVGKRCKAANKKYKKTNWHDLSNQFANEKVIIQQRKRHSWED